MPANKATPVRSAKAPLTPEATASRKFTKLLEQIEQLKADIEKANEQITSARVFLAETLNPLLEMRIELQRELIIRLHTLYGDEKLTKRERQVTSYMIQQYAEELLRTGDGSEEIRQIYDFYAPVDWKTQTAQQEALQVDIFNEMAEALGVDIKLDAGDSETALEEKLQQYMDSLEEAARAHAEQGQKRKKTKKQLEKEAAEKQKNLDIRKTVKEIYNNLVKLLHPDLEQDAEERLRKNEIIKQVNAAYESDDMFTLLQLQSAYLSRHSDQIAQLPEIQLDVFISILKRQKEELQQELQMICMGDPSTGELFDQLCSLSGDRQVKRKRNSVMQEVADNISAKKANLALTETLERFQEGIELLEVVDTMYGLQLVEREQARSRKQGKRKK